MTVAYDYPLLSVFFSMMWFFVWVIWLMTLFYVFADIFRSHDLHGGGKALWLIFVLLVPFLGVLVYLIARGDNMAQHSMEDAQKRDAQFQSYVKEAAGSASTGDQLAQLVTLRDSGAISPEEYEAGKAKVLA